MSVTIVRYSESLRTEWDAFVSHAINGTFLHGRSFYDCNPSNAADDHSLMFYSGNRLLALLPGTLYTGDVGQTFHSHNRSTYGGFLFNRRVGIQEAVDIVGALLHHLRVIGVGSAIIRSPFRILYDQISDEFEYAMWYHGFHVASREAEVYVDLTPPIDTIRSRFEKATRNNITRAYKDTEISIDGLGDIEQFWILLGHNLATKHGTKPTHSLESIRKLIGAFGVEKIRLFAAYVEGRLAAGCLVFTPCPSVLHAQYIAQDYELQASRPLNALIDSIITWGNANGFRSFNLGTANEGGHVINAGLFHFKEGFGGRSVLRETHRWDVNG